MVWLDKFWCWLTGKPYRSWEDWYRLYMLEREMGIRLTTDN